VSHQQPVDAPLVRVHATPACLSNVGSQLGYRQRIDVALPMVRRHLAAWRAELSAAERRAILGKRLGRLGRVAYGHGFYAEGLHDRQRDVARLLAA
jgi:hypothetical protein